MTTLWPILLVLISPLPVGTDRRIRHVPWVTYTLIALNVLAYVATVLYTRAHPGVDPFTLWGFEPGLPRFSTLFTSLFLHVSLGHLFWNMAFLWLFGPHVEDALGHVSFAALYFGGGVAAGLLHMAIVLLMVPQSAAAIGPLVGASGAISAILAPFAVRFHRSQIRLLWLPGLLLPGSWGQWELPAVAGLTIWLLQNVAGGIWALIHPESGGIAYWAHIGGFVFGLVAAELTSLFQEGNQEYLLQDARAAAIRGREALSAAAQKYRAFLDRDPDNAAIHAELGRALAQRARHRSEEGDDDRQDAALEFATAVRLFQKQGDPGSAARCCAEARAFGLPVALSPRERLRLGGAAADGGDPETALFLLRALITETPDAPEDEMARLRLGQLLLKADPAESHAVLSSFLDKYPHSEWVRLVRDLRAKTL